MGSIAIKSTFLISLMGLQGCDFLWNFFEPQFNVKEEDYIPGVVDGDPEPPYATPQMSKSTLLGIDKDNDGVRDDIEIWINRNVDEQKIRNYLKIYVKRKNNYLTCENENECLNAYRIHRRSSECFGLIRSEEWKTERVLKIERILDSFFFNNTLRKNAYAKMSNYLAATSWGSADYLGSILLKDSFCEFYIDLNDNDLKNIWSYSNRVQFVRNVKEGLYERYFNLNVDYHDYANICDGFDGPNKDLCD